jgi:hypothetical protein
MRDDPQARWLLRLPADWNGRLVVGVPPGVRSEHALDATHSDYLVSKGYAYAASNKGHLASRPSGASDPAACQASPPGGPGASVYVHGYQADLPPDRAFAVWVSRTVEIARLGKHLTTAYYGSRPTRTYVSGISAGALVTRRVLETDPEEFDGGLDWAAPHAGRGSDFNGLLGVFPSGLKSLPEYRASGYSPASAGYRALQAAFFPPDIFGAATPNSPAGSYLETHYNAVWTGLECGNQRILDPGYAGDPADYDFPRRRRETGLGSQLAAIETTGSPQRPLVTIHGTMDATAPIHGSRLYRADVVAAGRAALHRLYEVQNGTHRDRYRDAPTSFAEVEYMLPHFRDAFERLVRWVEDGQEPPPGQCIPRGERLADDPAAAVRPERCLRLLE